MNYIENIYVCLAAPLIIAILCTRRARKHVSVFLLCGMTVCLLSSYISTFIAAIAGQDISEASVDIAPAVEEIMKVLPIFFYILIFDPKKEEVPGWIQMIAVGFATFENVCWLTQNGAENVWFILVRGFGTGAMHIVCGALIATGLLYLWDQVWLRTAGTIGLIAVATTFHGIYNILVSQTGAAAFVGYLIPMLTTAFYIISGKTISDKMKS